MNDALLDQIEDAKAIAETLLQDGFPKRDVHISAEAFHALVDERNHLIKELRVLINFSKAIENRLNSQ